MPYVSLTKFVLSACFLLLCSCGRKPVSETRFLFNTYCRITIPADERNARDAIARVFQRFDEIERKFNVHLEGNPLFKFNQNGTPVNDKEIIEVSLLAAKLNRESDGYFDPTVYPLVKRWGFYSSSPSLPDEIAVKECLDLVGFDNVLIKEGMMSPRKQGIGIDFGGLIPGYAADEALKVIKSMGIRSALIDAGGELYAFGTINGKPWKIGLKNPRGEGVIGIIEAKDKAVVTSGDYERFFEKEGKRYHHILNPKTGYPPEGIQSVTILGPSAAECEGWAKAVFMMGVKKGLEAVEKKDGYEVIVITSSGEIMVSSGLKEQFKRLESKGERS